MKAMKTRKTWRRALALLSAALLVAGCGSDGDVPADGTERVALRVTSGISTRAADNWWTAGDAIGIYMLNGEAVDTYANSKYITEAGGTSGEFLAADAAEAIFLPTDGTERDFVAYYPYSGSLTADDSAYAINLSDQSSQEAIDLMAADVVGGKSRTDSEVSFVFAHKLAKIEVAVRPGDDVVAADLVGMTVKLTGQHVEGTYDVTAGGEVVPSSATEAITLLTADDGTSAEGIVFPSTDFSGMELTFSTQEIGDYSWALSSSYRATQFEAGKRYKYTITVNKTALEVTATITDWAEGNGQGDSGSAE